MFYNKSPEAIKKFVNVQKLKMAVKNVLIEKRYDVGKCANDLTNFTRLH